MTKPKITKRRQALEERAAHQGTEEQHLDMYEGPDLELRGDALLDHEQPRQRRLALAGEESELTDDEMLENFNVDMSEELREGDEMSGDDHSSGLQGGEEEIEHQEAIDTGMPGEETDLEELEVDRREKERAA